MIGDKKDLCVLGLSDTSYHQEGDAVSGELVLLGNRRTTMVSPLY